MDCSMGRSYKTGVLKRVSSKRSDVARTSSLPGSACKRSRAIDGSRVKGEKGDPERAIGSETIGTGADFGPNDGTLVFLAVGVTVIAFTGTGLGMVVGACLVGASEGVLVTGPTLGVVASGKEGTPDSNICANGGSCSGGGVEIGGCVGGCVLRSSLGIAVAAGPMLMADGCSVEAS